MAKAAPYQIRQAMQVRNTAAGLLQDHEDQPVDVWELTQETSLTERQVKQAMRYLVANKLADVTGTATEEMVITEVHSLFD
jgi:hypothetical protein